MTIKRDRLIHEHIHEKGNVWPTVGAGGAGWVAGTNVAANAVAGTFGNYAIVIPAATVTLPFDIHWANIETIGTNGSYEMIIAIGAPGAEVEVSRIRFVRFAGNEPVNGRPVITPVLPANSAVSVKIAHSTAVAAQITVSLCYHTY